jgi:hypothetical protein
VTYLSLISTAFVLSLGLQPPVPPTLPQPEVKQQPPAPKDPRLAADFTARVEKYVEMRKKADDSAPPLKETKDSAKIKAAQQALVERIGAARSDAKQGDIFTPEIAAYFRHLMRPESKETGTKEIMKEDKVGTVPFKINGPYPDEKPLVTAPPNILGALPPLPKDIDYRFVGKHLILRDSRANSIIDYMLNAIP